MCSTLDDMMQCVEDRKMGKEKEEIPETDVRAPKTRLSFTVLLVINAVVLATHIIIEINAIKTEF